MVFVVAKYDDSLSGKQLYHEGKSNFLFFIPRMYGDRKAAIANLRQWVSICLGRRVVFEEKQGLVSFSKEIPEIILSAFCADRKYR